MKISAARPGAAQSAQGQSQKNISSLSRGDTFTATVAGVSGGEVTLTLANGSRFTAKAQNSESIANGEKLSFTVEANEDGKVFVRMSKEDGGQNLLRIAAKALAESELPATETNLLAAKALIEKGISVDFEKLHKAAFGMSLETMTPEKLLFFLTEDIEINEGNLKQLNGNIINGEGLSEAIGELIDRAASMPENEMDAFAKLLFGKQLKTHVTKGALEKLLKRLLYKDIAGDGEKELGKYYGKLYDAALRILSGMEESGDTKELLSSARDIKQALEFQNEINGYKQYMQIPFVIDGLKGQGDLYVFKDGKAQNLKKQATVLLCLNLANIGHTEVFITKNEKSLTCAFGLSQPSFIKLFKDNSFELHKLLAQKGFKIEKVSFEQADGAFNLLKERPDAQQNHESKQKKYSFDARA